MTKQEMAREILEGLERIALFFHQEDLMLRSERSEQRKMIHAWATDLAVKLKGEINDTTHN